MHRATCSILASVSAAACLLVAAESAQAQLPTPAEPLLMVDQIRDAFTTAGYQVDQVKDWDWTSPPATSLQVQDPASGRTLMVLVYRSSAGAYAARLQAEGHERVLNAGNPINSPGPHLVSGYGPSVWNHNVAMVQTTLAERERVYEVQNNRDCGFNVDADLLQDIERPALGVGIDFQQALHNGALNWSDS